MKFSSPVQLAISSMVRGSVPFNQVADQKTMIKLGTVPANLKVGQRVDAWYIGNGNFSLLEKPMPKVSLSKGSLITARFVKHVVGKGVTVQLSHNQEQNQFGFLPICEITDDLAGNAVKHIADRSIFVARIIDFDSKGGKPIISARESVVDDASWASILPAGSSAVFKQNDEER
jgi:hypothetical protein